MNDAMIRKELRGYILSGASSNSILIDEMGCCQGSVRIDLALINDAIHGYEIKSEVDNLLRLPMQSQGYNFIFNTLTIVACYNHIEEIINLVPSWWGVVQATEGDDVIFFKNIRSSSINPQRRSFEIASLLWKEEAFGLVEKYSPYPVNARCTRQDLWSHLTVLLSVDNLTEEVCQIIKNRKTWRSDLKQMLGDDSSQHVARSRGSRLKLSRSRSPQYIDLPN